MKTIKLLSAAVCIIFLASCTGNAKENKKVTNINGPAEVEQQTVSNTEKITVVLPDGWTRVEGSSLEHQYIKGTVSFMVNNEALLNRKSLDEAIDIVKIKLKKHFETAKFSETEKLEIDHHNAQSITFTYAVSSMEMKMQSNYVMVNNKCYNISFGGLTKEFEALSADFEQILEGIKFNN